ncbi:MAG: FUSC family protein [Pseudolysinimonas sp.]
MAARIRSSLAQAVVTMLAILATIAVCLLIAPEPGPAVLGAMLCLTLSRSQLERDWRGRLEAGIALPFIGLLSAGVGLLLLNLRIVGAVVYVLGMFLSIFLRRFGPIPRRLGSLLALPFIALLVAPNPVPTTIHGPFAVLVPALVALVAFAFVTVFQVAAMGIRMLPRPVPAAESARSSERPPGAGRVDPTTRLALQMALALALAFTIGFLFFPDRWAWIVLTVVVVAVGNTGRADVLYKGIQRVLGAALGTIVALLGLTVPALGGPNLPTVIVLLAIVFVAVFLRPFAYLWWALFFTLALTLLQSFASSTAAVGPLLGERLEEILLGTALALLVAWFVLPLRSENTVRRRISLVLAALQDRLADQTPDTDRALTAAEKDLARVAAPYKAWRRFFRHSTRPRAGLWIATTRASVELGRDGGSAAARTALGEARRTLRDPDALQPALEKLRATLAGEPD